MKLNGGDFLPIFMMGFLTCGIVKRLDGTSSNHDIFYPIVILVCVVAAFIAMQIHRKIEEKNNDDS